MSKKNFLIICLQVVIVAVFSLIAAGSGSDGAATKSNSVLRAAAQGGICGGAGYTFIGYYDTKSACKSACARKGYSAWCSGEDTTACYCQ